MSVVELKRKQQEIDNDLNKLLDSDKWFGKTKKRFNALVKERNNLQREIDKLEGRTYDSDKWITKYHAESYVSLKDARLKLAEMIKDLHGVELDESETGVSRVVVYTEYKIYYYTIHAHYFVEKIEESKRIIKGMFGQEHEEYDYRQVYVATIDTNGSHWAWRY